MHDITNMSFPLQTRIIRVATLLVISFSVVLATSRVDTLQLNAFTEERHMEDLATLEGYPMEKHLVSTGDGYTLAVYRIPHGRLERRAKAKRPVIFLQHGLLDSSAAFAMNGANGSLAFVFADAGFDVWLGNCRGNTFSNFEMQVGMTHDQFWDFSLDELIFHDLPSSLQYVLDVTSVEKFIYMGHSQGTAIAHALFSSQHPITKHIALAVMLAPVAYVQHITSQFLRNLALINTEKFVAMLGFHQFLPSHELMHILGGTLCLDSPFTCENLLALLCGYNKNNIDPARWETFLKYTPAGTSVKVMAHWAQAVRSKGKARFQAYDYGKNCFSWRTLKYKPCNQWVYRNRSPPEYDLAKINVPLVFFQGGHDALSDVHDVQSLKRSLKPGVLIEDHILLDYEHMDFLWGKNAPEKVCNRIIYRLKKLFGATMNPENPLMI